MIKTEWFGWNENGVKNMLNPSLVDSSVVRRRTRSRMATGLITSAAARTQVHKNNFMHENVLCSSVACLKKKMIQATFFCWLSE